VDLPALRELSLREELGGDLVLELSVSAGDINDDTVHIGSFLVLD